MTIKRREVNQMRRDMLEDGIKPGKAKLIAEKKTNTKLATGKVVDKKKKPTLRGKKAVKQSMDSYMKSMNKKSPLK